MTDAELTSLAAKAYGNAPDGFSPLTDDGDALRLAVKLGIHVSQQCSYVACSLPHGSAATRGLSWNENYQGAPFAATRRAITSAAAAIGEAMP